jgi:hypothetical protein
MLPFCPFYREESKAGRRFNDWPKVTLPLQGEKKI